MTDETRPHLRDCPMCHAAGADDEKVYLMKDVVIGHDCEFTTGYTVFCTECGVRIDSEDKDEVVRLWNGELPAADEEALA